MARRCEICSRGTAHGRSLSHAHNVSNRTFQVNLQKVRAHTPEGPRRIRVCTRCLRAGRVQKIVR